ncbi:MAG: hypothetical protein CSA33_04605 [Desulfobulbus propionicus]|nr:MAG: hypothetical protein CSA33_04605 [Desulfobulbus propionicus]
MLNYKLTCKGSVYQSPQWDKKPEALLVPIKARANSKAKSLEGITAIAVDQIQYRKGHNYLTLLYQINKENRRLLWIGKE